MAILHARILLSKDIVRVWTNANQYSGSGPPTDWADTFIAIMATYTGFEPMIYGMKTRCPRPLDE